MSRERKNGSERRLPDGDDGRTIANMNVDGMPWYSPAPKKDDPRERGREELLSPRDRRRYILGALLAAIALAAIFGAAYFLFLLFCTKVWFR